ncbi:NAD-dependent epimerase/dehydratase family protein [Herbiconiux sp. CPCC 205716]|uniref:NAD-dependent epimerase/dehydratase family protein n=1 Tax=Herbiconiux gentiana TaxID=2970912 RepID=A0ABT2GGA9_9MICO|nr:NAD-dependent epimerase/dehydratase family protein [Herbiconiux gentiana]MCS5715208.1 NAD-dependent epimerase/dehydratase family protein [Herbiconiux gentiana]
MSGGAPEGRGPVRVLVTGASGFVGGALLARLGGDAGFEAIGVGRRPSGGVAGYRVLDLADAGAAPALDALPAPDVIVHAAARSSPWGSRAEFERENVDLTRTVLAYAARLPVPPRVVLVSSASVLTRAADQLDVPSDAAAHPPFVSRYAATKAAAERLVHDYRGEWVVLRPRAVFGPGDGTLLPRVLGAAAAGRLPEFAAPEPVRSDLVHIDTLVEYLVRAATRPAAVGRTLVVTGGEAVELQAVVRRMIAAAGLPAPRRRVSRRVALAVAGAVELAWRVTRRGWEPPITRYSVSVYAFSTTFDDSATRAVLGEPIVSTAEGLERLIADLAADAASGSRSQAAATPELPPPPPTPEPPVRPPPPPADRASRPPSAPRVVPGAERRWEERVQRTAHPLAYPLLARIRRATLRVPRVGVIVSDAALLRAVLLDTESFTKTGPGSSAELWTPVLGPSVLLNMEGADHAALRRRLAPLFAPGFVGALTEDTIGDGADRLTARLVAGEAVDLVAEVREYAGQVISRLMGLDRGVMGEELFARVSAVTGFVSLARPRFTPAQVGEAREVLDELTRHARRAYREAPAPAAAAGSRPGCAPDAEAGVAPAAATHAGAEAATGAGAGAAHATAAAGARPGAAQGAVHETLPGRMRGLGLSEEEAMGAVGAFVLTGTETLVSYLPRLVAILADTGWLDVLAHDRRLLDAAIGEGLRVTTPSPVMLRSVARAARVGERDVHPGDRLVLATFLANRGAGRFDPVANPAASLKQLWFGAGAHFCLGAPLAMTQIQRTIGAVLDAHAEAPLTITGRRAQRGALIPAYRSLTLERARR